MLEDMGALANRGRALRMGRVFGIVEVLRPELVANLDQPGDRRRPRQLEPFLIA